MPLFLDQLVAALQLPTYTTGAIGEGGGKHLGLGLSICRRSVEASGGEARVRDLPGKGCVLTIDLPRHLTP